jgi:1,4-dihydroxy-2-naphthoate octaprenyltransferase
MMVAVPMILLIGLIMATNNIRDRVGDAKNGRRTIPILLGHNTAVRLALISFILVYAWPVVLMVKYLWLPFILLPVITVKSAVTVIKIIWQEGKEPMEMMPAVQTTAQLVFSYGALYLVGLLLAV